MGNTPPWMVSRIISVAVAAIGSYPLLAAVLRGHAGAGTAVSQAVVSAVVLGIYLAIANLALAGAAFAEPVLFGRIIDALTGARTGGQ